MNDVFMTTDLKATKVFKRHPSGDTVSHMPEVQQGGLSYKMTT